MKRIIKQLKGVLLGTLIVVFICGCGKSTVEYISSESEQSENSEVKDSENAFEETEVEEDSVIYVYVCGAIQNPGVYTMPEGSRVCDAFEKAGGFTPDAATAYWNQARILKDGEMLYVPTKEEVENGDLPSAENEVSDTDNQGDNENNKININTASLEELMTIPGIGQAKASAIIKYRQEHGVFSSIEEVKNIEGIKDGVFSKIKEYIDIN